MLVSKSNACLFVCLRVDPVVGARHGGRTASSDIRERLQGSGGRGHGGHGLAVGPDGLFANFYMLLQIS